MNKILETIIEITTKLISIGISLAVLYLIGWRGILGAIIGMSLLIYMIVSGNTMFLTIVKLIGGDNGKNYVKQLKED